MKYAERYRTAQRRLFRREDKAGRIREKNGRRKNEKEKEELLMINRGKRIGKKSAAAFLAISIVLTMAGCRKPKEKQKKEYRVVKETDPYYSASEVELIIPRKEGKELLQLLVDEPEISDGKIRF